MNQVFKRSLIFSVTFGLIVSVMFMPVSVVNAERGSGRTGSSDSSDDNVVAQTSTSNTDSSNKSGFCNGLSKRAEQINKNVADKVAKMESAQTKRDQEIAANQSKWDSEIKSARDEADAQRKENFTKLEAKATTDEQKSAVLAYEKSVTEAVSARRANFDAARASFRSSIEADIMAHQTDVKTQIATMKSSVASAIATAQAECSSNPSNSSSIRQKLIASLKEARMTFKDQRKNDTKVSDDIGKIQETKKTAFEDAKKTFKSTTSEARETLKTALEKKN